MLVFILFWWKGGVTASVSQRTGALRDLITGTVKGRFASVSVRIEGLENHWEKLTSYTLTVLDTLNLARRMPY